VEIHSPLAELAAHLRDHPETLRVVLATGDPNFFGIAEYLYRHFPVNALVVAPALSSMQEAFSRLKMSWHDAFFGSVHGRPLEQAVLWVARHEKVAILTDPRHNAAALAQTLTRAGFAESELYVCQNVGMDGENIVEGLAKDLQQCPDGGFSVVVVRNRRAPRPANGLEQTQLERRDHHPGKVT
jgi:precorrin-6Y C5,15-methyltransferase (decarboxylating)